MAVDMFMKSNRLFTCLFVLVFNLLRFLHFHHTHSVNTRYLCGSGEIEPRAKTEAVTATDTSLSKKLVFRVTLANPTKVKESQGAASG
jgi:hypothetical protein